MAFATQTHHNPLTNEAGEVRELTGDDIARMRPAREALPPELYADLVAMNKRAGVRGPQKAPTKVALSLRLSPQVVEAFKATGEGWQSRINAALVQWLKGHKPEDVQA